jgi:ferritin-like metal-binding protein YciE
MSQKSEVQPTLESLQFYYQTIAADYENMAKQAREQLDRIEAILSSSVRSSQTSVKPAAAAVAPAAILTAKAPTPAPSKPVPAPRMSVSKREAPARRGSAPRFVKAYQSKTMLDAIGQVLEENRGTSVSIEDVVQSLYGDLKPSLYKIAKDRVTKGLSKGKVNGMWQKVSGQQGFYTVS